MMQKFQHWVAGLHKQVPNLCTLDGVCKLSVDHLKINLKKLMKNLHKSTTNVSQMF